MIFFKKDIVEQRAYIDKTTKNKSFIRFAMLLKDLGVSNNKFHLVIYDKGLIGVDPHSPNLTLDQKRRIGVEAKLNPWYYFREVIRIPQSGAPPSRFILNRANCAMIWLYYNHVDVFQVCPRQTGKTIATIAIFSHVIYIQGDNIELSMLTISDKLRNENVSRLKHVRDLLPKYMIFRSSKDKDNIQEISYEYLSNSYKTYCYSQSITAADNTGRGMTSPSHHHDEFGMAYNNHITYPVAMDTTSAAIKTARENDQPSSNILTTTAGRLDTAEGKFAYEKLQSALPFTEKMYDLKDRDELYQLVDSSSGNGMVYTVYSFLQLGYDWKWYNDRIRKKGGTQDDIDRDYFNIWKHGSSKSLLDQETLIKLKDSVRDPNYVEVKNGYMLKWYIPEHFVKSGMYKDVPMVMGMDSSDNVGKDFTTLVLLDARDLSVVMTCRCNESNLIVMTHMVIDFMIEYPKVTLIPERNYAGTIIDLMLDRFEAAKINPYKRIYNDVVQNKDDQKYRHIDTTNYRNITGQKKSSFGFSTNSSQRKLLYQIVFSKAMQLNATKVHDQTIVQEISTLTVKNNRIDHRTGQHDDMVIAYLLANYLLFFGKNLNFYGLSGKDVLADIGTAEDRQVSIEKQRQKELRLTAQNIQKQLHHSASPLMRGILSKKLAAIRRLLTDDTTLSPDSEVSAEKYRKEPYYNKNDSRHNNDKSTYTQEEISAIF